MSFACGRIQEATTLSKGLCWLHVTGIPVYGVNLPEHFVLCYKDEEAILPIFTEENQLRILFYINPFSKGDIFGKKEIDNFLKQLKIQTEQYYYEPCTNLDMIQRLIR